MKMVDKKEMEIDGKRSKRGRKKIEEENVEGEDKDVRGISENEEVVKGWKKKWDKRK